MTLAHQHITYCIHQIGESILLCFSQGKTNGILQRISTDKLTPLQRIAQEANTRMGFLWQRSIIMKTNNYNLSWGSCKIIGYHILR